MTTITCKISDKLDAQLEATARRRRVSKSTVVRQALEQRLRRENRVGATTAFDLVKSLCGSLRGPKDLSHNSKRLEGLGA